MNVSHETYFTLQRSSHIKQRCSAKDAQFVEKKFATKPFACKVSCMTLYSLYFLIDF